MFIHGPVAQLDRAAVSESQIHLGPLVVSITYSWMNSSGPGEARLSGKVVC